MSQLGVPIVGLLAAAAGFVAGWILHSLRAAISRRETEEVWKEKLRRLNVQLEGARFALRRDEEKGGALMQELQKARSRLEENPNDALAAAAAQAASYKERAD